MHAYSTLRAGCLAGVLGVCTPTVHAQADAPPQKIEVTANTQRYDARRDDTASRIIVSREEILRQGDTALADVLKRLPGLSLGRGGDIRMRGLGAGYTQILLDGQPAPPGFSLDALAPDALERIEIIRAATADTGARAIAGTINLVLRKAPPRARREERYVGAVSASLRQATANLEWAEKRTAFAYTVSANASVTHLDQPSRETLEGDGPEPLLRHTANRNHGPLAGLTLTPRLTWTFGATDTLALNSALSMQRTHRHARHDRTVEVGPAPAILTDASQGSTADPSVRSELLWTRQLDGGGRFEMRAGLSAAARFQDFTQQGRGPAGDLVHATIRPSAQRDRGVTFAGKFSRPLSGAHMLGAGWDAAATSQRVRREQHDAPLNAGALDLDERFGADVRRLSAWVQDEWVVSPGWSAYAGLRWESIATASRGTGFDPVRHCSSVLSPSLQTLWKLGGGDQLRFALSRTYKPPAPSRLVPRLYTTLDNSPSDPDMQGNPGLRPELAWGLDAAFEHHFAPGALFSAALYARRIADVTLPGLMMAGGRWVSMPVNAGRADVRGAELEWKAPLRALLADAPALDVRFNLARNWSAVAAIAGPGNRLADQAPLTVNLGADGAIAAWRLGGTFSYRAGGAVRLSATQSTDAARERTLDAYALWKRDARAQVRIAAANLLSQPRRFVARYDGAAGSEQRTETYPAGPVLRVSVEWRH